MNIPVEVCLPCMRSNKYSYGPAQHIIYYLYIYGVNILAALGHKISIKLLMLRIRNTKLGKYWLDFNLKD